jgi:zinc protease
MVLCNPMKRRPRSLKKNRFPKLSRLAVVVLPLFLCLGSLVLPTPTTAQDASEPRREQLLNGLKVFLLPRPSDTEVLVKLRIQSGAAFDLTGKEGLMALLGDALFSDPTTRQYVTEELGGKLEITTDYDSINVTMTGHAAQFERLVELLRGALVSTQLSTEMVARLREARLKAVREVSVSPATVADRAIAARLFGSYPYGRVVDGTPESLARIERADLLLIRERFLNPNNATLAVVGGVQPPRAMRALRQYLGVWRKSDVEVPSTFRQPEAPDARTLVVDFAGVPDAEMRLAARGLSRTDRDSVAARVLAVLASERWRKNLPELKERPFFVSYVPHTLPGAFRLGASVPTPLAPRALEAARSALQSLVTTQAGTEELEFAKRETVAALNKTRPSETEMLADSWLDKELYGLNYADEARAVGSLTAADVQRVASRLFGVGNRIASVVVGDAAQLRVELARTGEIEVFGASAAAPEPKPLATPTPTQKPLTVPVRRP